MLRRIAFYPFLFILFVILNPLTSNLDELNPVLALRPLVILLVTAAALLVLFQAIVKNWQYAGYLLFLGLLLIFLYGHVMNVVLERLPEEYEENYPLGILGIMFILLIILGLKWTWKRFGGSGRVTPFLNLVLVIAVASQGVLGLWELARRSPDLSRRSDQQVVLPETGIEMALDCSISPDIYWIILDGYGRSDVLKEIYGVDTSAFLSLLEQKGFYVARKSHSNYIQTVYSIPSALNFTYLDPMPAHLSGYDYFPELIARNRLMALLRQCGYRMVTFETGFFFTNYPEADEYHSIGVDLNDFEGLLLASTPFELLVDELDLEPLARSYEAHRRRVHFTFGNLAEAPNSPGPKFVYAHIISPHPPYVFDAEGNPVQPRRGYSIGDGNDYRGSWEEYQRGYAAQVQYVNQLLDETISEIVSQSTTPPVIIIQGDHGPGGHLQWKYPSRTCLWERTSILNAYYLPNGGAKHLYPDISPVNSFRVVLNAYFGTDLEMLPSETLFTSSKPGGAFIDVTDRRESRENCGN